MWSHKPNPVPKLEREDLETILLLCEKARLGKLARRAESLKAKVEDSMCFYHWQDSLIESARENMKNSKKRGTFSEKPD